MAQPIDVYYWPTPNGHKVTIALEEMGYAYNLIPINIGTGDQFAPEFLKISPNNRMPAIIDHDTDDGAPLSIFESGAIVQHLGCKSGKFNGKTEREKATIEQWIHFQMANQGPMFGQANHFRNYARTIVFDSRQTAYGAIRYSNEAQRICGVLNKLLADRDYVAGDYSLADMMLWPWMTVVHVTGVDMTEFPNLKAWVERVRERPAVQAAMARVSEINQGPSLMSAGAAGEAARRILFGQRAR